MLMYLTDVEHGGETVFPDSKEKPVRAQACSTRAQLQPRAAGAGAPPSGRVCVQHLEDAGLQECARSGVHVKPRKGDALLFYSLELDGSLVRPTVARQIVPAGGRSPPSGPRCAAAGPQEPARRLPGDCRQQMERHQMDAGQALQRLRRGASERARARGAEQSEHWVLGSPGLLKSRLSSAAGNSFACRRERTLAGSLGSRTLRER